MTERNYFMTLPVYQHADGGHYVIEDDQNHQMKMDDGRWEPAVLYRGVETSPGGGFMYRDKHTFSTTKKRWAERFTLIGDSSK